MRMYCYLVGHLRPSFCVREVKALARLRICAGSPEPLLKKSCEASKKNFESLLDLNDSHAKTKMPKTPS